jgi:hypothetical protein|tara:strand:- start:811 stop:915 length:105 start_codon:yes stop_codon:yes gene_type:complete
VSSFKSATSNPKTEELQQEQQIFKIEIIDSLGKN